MRILFHHRIASRDGQAVHMEELCAALRKLGHTVILVGPAGTAQLEFGGEAGLVAWLKQHLPGAIYELLELGYNLIALLRLWRAVRQHRPDAVYERYNLFCLAGPILCALCRLPLLLEINAPLCEERSAAGSLALKRLAAWAQHTAWRAADYALPVTAVLADYVRRTGVPEERIKVIPNGVDWQKFSELPARDDAKRRLGLSGKVVLGFTGFVRHWNRLDRIVDLLPRLAANIDAHLLLVGDGPAREGLVARASACGVADRLTITGIVERDAVAAHIAAFDIALQPGITEYASPLKLFEYMATGAAIIAPDRPNIREVLTDRVNALLIDPDQPEQLAAAIVSLCQDEALRRRLGAAARNTIDQRGFTWLSNARSVSALVAACLAQEPSAVERGTAPSSNASAGRP